LRLPAFKNFLLILASVMAGLMVMEVALRVFDIAYPEFHRLDDHRGWAPRAGVEGWWTKEGKAYIRINAAGFRDRDHETAKPDGVFRLAVLGDSFTEARALPLAETFWSVAGRNLGACPALDGARVEVLNFGVSGYGTAQQLITLRDHVLAYAPDLVLLAFYSGNDVWNNNRALDGHADRPYYTLDGDSLVLDDSFRRSARFQTKMAWQDIKHGLVNASHVLQLVKAGYYASKAVWRGANTATAGFAAAPSNGVYRPPADDAWRDAWAVTEALIAALRDDVAASGATLWVASLSNAIQAHPDPEVRRAFTAALGIGTLSYPDDRIAAFAAAQGISAIALAPALRAYAEANDTTLHGFANGTPGYGHWNRQGHAQAGALIAQALCAGL
jgi:lysophospholipase L1-like esterase